MDNCGQLSTIVQVKTIVNNCGYQLKTISQFQGFYKSCLGAEVESWSSYVLCFFDTYRARKTKRSKKTNTYHFFLIRIVPNVPKSSGSDPARPPVDPKLGKRPRPPVDPKLGTRPRPDGAYGAYNAYGAHGACGAYANVQGWL